MSVLGIDIGGSGIKGALVDVETGALLSERLRLPTPELALPEDVANTVCQLVRQFQWQGAVGCGFPAAVRGGVAMTAANIHKDWIGIHAEELFSQTTGCPTRVVNDADAAGVAEMTFGAGRAYPKGVVIMVTIGTGLGTAVFTDGYLVPNTELGHLEMDGKDAEVRASDAARKRKNLSWSEWGGGRLQQYFQMLERLFWPTVFIVGGGVSKEPDRFLPYIKTNAPIIPAQLQNQAGIVGAALYASRAG